MEVAFTPQINEFRGVRSVQLNLVDIRPDRETRRRSGTARALYDKFAAGERLNPDEAAALLPEREDFSALWRYLAAQAKAGLLIEDLSCLNRKLARAGSPIRAGRVRICLDVLAERGLITLETVGSESASGSAPRRGKRSIWTRVPSSSPSEIRKQVTKWKLPKRDTSP